MKTTMNPPLSGRLALLASLAALATASVSHADLLLHWNLDEPDGDYTSPPGYLEEVNNTTANTLEVASGTDILEGQAGLVPDGGTCISLTDTEPASYIDAGTVQADGAYVAGTGDGTFRVLSGAYSITACARYAGSGDRIIISSDWDSSTGWMLGFRNGEIFFDFGNRRKTTGNHSVTPDTTYLIAVRFDDTKSVFGGGVNDYSISFWDGTAWNHSDGTVDRGIRLQGLEIGAYNSGTRELTGLVDDVRVYDHTLSQFELDELAGVASPLALGPVNVTRTDYNEADVGCSINLDADEVTIYWGTSDPGETTTGWSGTPIPLGAKTAGLVTATLTGLSEDTTYFCRYHASITSPAADAWSPPGTFTTPVQIPPPRLGDPATTATRDDGADVECQVLDAGATSTWVVWDTSDQGTPTHPPGSWAHSMELGAANQDDLLSATITNADGDTTYVFRFFAANDSGPAWSTLGSFDTGLGNETAPTGLAVDLVDGTIVHLSWVDSYETETGFVVQRADDAGFTLNLRTFTVPADATSYPDGTGAAVTTYHYRVAAVNAGGQTPFSSSVAATTGEVSPPVPILHWKLDDAGPAFREEITGDTSNTVAVRTVTTGQPALAPDGGFSVSLTVDDPPSYIDAGTVQADNSYVAGIGDGTCRTLAGAYTVTAWAHYTGLTSADRVIVSSDWNPGTGWRLGFRDGGIFFDFGNITTSTGPATVLTDQSYLISVRFDDTKSVFGGGVNDYSISFWDGTTWTHSDGTVDRAICLQGLEIGSFNTGTRQIEGFLDDIRIYDTTLVQADLDTLAAGHPDRKLVLKVTHDRPAGDLVFTWNGRVGVTYNLLASPDLSPGPPTWGAILSGVTSPQTIARPAAGRSFYALEENP
jgi:hypothetical protein